MFFTLLAPPSQLLIQIHPHRQMQSLGILQKLSPALLELQQMFVHLQQLKHVRTLQQILNLVLYAHTIVYPFQTLVLHALGV